MKALVKAESAPGIWMQDVPVPNFGSHDVLIKIKKTSICGTDVHIHAWDEWAQATIPVPMTIGHEFYGEIVDVGSDVKQFKLGQLVSGEGHITCDSCRSCRAGKRHLCPNTRGIGVNRDGCFAEYLALPASNVVVLPEEINPDNACILDPLGNAVHCALSFDMEGEDVLITGAGPIGIMAVAVARHVGARHIVITDVNEIRLNLALQMGATRAVNVTQQSISDVMSELGIAEGFAVGLEMSGNAMAWSDLLNAMANGGHIAMLGIPPHEVSMNLRQIIFKGLVLKGIYGREMFETWHKMIAMLQSGLDVSAVITHHFPVADYQQAFELMASGQTGKVILDWS